MAGEPKASVLGRPWRVLFGRKSGESLGQVRTNEKEPKPTWTMGILNDRETIEVPGKCAYVDSCSSSQLDIGQLTSYLGSVLLLSNERNEPLGLRNAPARTSHSSLPTGMRSEPTILPPVRNQEEKKLTKDGQIILEPQPDDSRNDPLNWPSWRRDCALVSLGLYCMVGGGITPILAAGFTNVAQGKSIGLVDSRFLPGSWLTLFGDFDIDISRVSLTTGLVCHPRHYVFFFSPFPRYRVGVPVPDNLQISPKRSWLYPKCR